MKSKLIQTTTALILACTIVSNIQAQQKTELDSNKAEPNKSIISISFLPNLSINNNFSNNNINYVAINLLVGNNKGVELAEFAGLVNIDNGKVKYAQFAGVGNIVGDTVKGAQMAGVFNINNSFTYGIQSAGVLNISQAVEGIQASGVANFSTNIKGAQFAGVYNYNKDSVKGLQVSGVFNSTKNIAGTQISGFMNYAENIEGMQLSGFVNMAKKVKGIQLGVINIADSCNGIPFGMLSFVKNGLHKIEMNTNELSFLNIGYRTGVKSFHNILTVGHSLKYKDWWTIGYGIGTTLKLNNRLGISIDALANHYFENINEIPELASINRLQTQLEFSIINKLQIGIGPALSILVAENNANFLESKITPRAFYTHTNNNSNIITKMWFGAGITVKAL